MSKNYAVIEINTNQYLVEEGNRFDVDHMDVETPVRVIFANIDGTSFIGKPEVKEVGVEISITGENKSKKLRVGRYKSKSRYRKEKSHRQVINNIRIDKIGKSVKNSIKVDDSYQKADDNASKPVAVKAEKTEKKVEKVETKADKKSVSVNKLDISDNMKERLEEAGYMTIEDVKKAPIEDLKALKGFGDKAIEKLMSSIEKL